MEYRRLGRSGLKVSAVGLGTWLNFGGRVDDGGAAALVRKARLLGINHFDTADVYEDGAAEEALGRAIAGLRRSDFVLSSKCFYPVGPGPNDRGLSRKHVDESVHASLRRLGTDYLDLHLCHRYDEETPVGETVRAYDDLIRQGKLLYWGVSMWSAPRIEEAVTVAREMHAVPPVCNQAALNLLRREAEGEIAGTCARLGLGLVAHSPLAQGVLTGKYRAGAPPEGSRAADPARGEHVRPWLAPERLARVERLRDVASGLGLTCAQAALAWLLAKREVSCVLVGARLVSQLEEDAAAVGARLPPESIAALDAAFPA